MKHELYPGEFVARLVLIFGEVVDDPVLLPFFVFIGIDVPPKEEVEVRGLA